ncbi:hypothetical protein ACWF94_22550, partial [Streptomyces sp. NPDC055078]
VRSQARFEYLRWRREVRRTAYSALITEAVTAEEGFRQAWTVLSDGDPARLDEAMEHMRTAENLVSAVRRAASTVAVEGPAAVDRSAEALMAALTSALSALFSWHADILRGAGTDGWKDRYGAHVMAARARLKEFSVAARAALDDDTHGSSA